MVARAPKDLTFHGDARERLLRGIDTVTKAVRVTLGPRGRNVVIAPPFGIGSPRITKDGVTVAKEIELRDKFENMGAQMLKEVAIRTSHEAGDGTTTATVLSHALIRGGVKAVAAGLSPMEVKRGMLLGKAMQKVGTDGVITLGQARSVDTQLDFVDGMQFDRGYVSPQFITDQQKMICELEDPYILVHEKTFDQLQALLPLREALLKKPKPLLVIADDFAPDVLGLLVLNNGRGGMQTAAVKAPRFGEQRKGLMEDIAILTGGSLFSEERGVTLWNASLDMLGRAKSVRVEKENTIIIDGAGKKAEIAARTNMLRAQIADMTTDYDRQRLRATVWPSSPAASR
jgi:chaperonin GroEL